ncbi:SAM-dependent methyltransferase [Mycolicibacterium frederiksbergense]|uniref:SAM-dependent methyltransferase n=1 Tax=Mycolicibacterium frederiksbergense TaxID=117567 RepID=UPI00247346F6|nr:SAM-dependent methyltransferase [Mycolicibacterium frederiksbergense]
MPSSCAADPAHPLDRYLLSAVDAGARQVVFLSSDLDPRPYELPWPEGTSVYVVDEPAILDVKTAALADATPTATVRGVPADIRGNWPAALTRAGFDTNQRTLWSVEGVLPFLPCDEQYRLVGEITALSAQGSRLISEIPVSPFGDVAALDTDVMDANPVDTDNRWRGSAEADMIVKWQWRFAASRYVSACLTSERPTSAHEAVEAVLDSVDHPGSGGGGCVHGDAGAHVLRRRRWFGHFQRQGR